MTTRATWSICALAIASVLQSAPASARPNRAANEAADIALGALPERTADTPAQRNTSQKEVPEAAPVDTGPKRVVVADFDAPDRTWARPSILAVLAAEPDVEVVGWQDVVIVARRLGADPSSTEGRRTIAAEMRLFAWVDGTVSDGVEARIWMTAASGERLAWLEARAANDGALNRFVEQHAWQAFGPFLSEAERERQALEAQKALAREKQEARAAELVRQRELAARRAERAADRLATLKQLAVAKAAAREAELAHQREVVAERRAAELRAQQEAEQARLRAEREAAQARQRELAEARRRQWAEQARAANANAYAQPAPAYAQPTPTYAQPAPVQPAPAYAQPAPTYAQPAPTYAQPAPAQPAYAQPAPTYAQPAPAQPAYTQPRPAAPIATGSAGYDPFADNSSPAFEAWAAQRKAELRATGASN